MRIGFLVISELYFYLSVLLVIIFKSLSATLIVKLNHEVNAKLMLGQYPIIPQPIIVSLFEIRPVFLLSRYSSYRLEVIQSLVVALH